jgi:hypothetical protein
MEQSSSVEADSLPANHCMEQSSSVEADSLSAYVSYLNSFFHILQLKHYKHFSSPNRDYLFLLELAAKQ